MFLFSETFKGYHKSCKAREKRVSSGQEENHIRSCRRRSRKEEVCYSVYNAYHQGHRNDKKAGGANSGQKAHVLQFILSNFSYLTEG